MSSAIGGILGGGSKGGGSSKTTNAYNMMPKNLRDILDSYLTTGQTLANEPYTPYTGQRIEPFSQFENMARDYGVANFGQAAPAIQGANQLNSQLTQRAIEGPTMANLQPYMSPFQQGVTDQAKRETVRDFEMNQLPGIGRQAAGQGAFGGSRQALLESNAYRDLSRNLTDIQERGSQAGFTNSQDMYFRTLQGAGDLAKSTAQTALLGQNAVNSDITMMGGLGQAERAMGQAQKDLDYGNFMNELNYPMNSLNVLGGLFSNVAPYFSPSSVPSSGNSGGSNLLNTAIQLAPMALQAFTPSDERVKENKEQVGELDNGLPVYSYNYKGSPKTQIGVMAQDVEKDNPEAVTEMGGVKMVDYNKATKKFFGGGFVGQSGTKIQWDGGGSGTYGGTGATGAFESLMNLVTGGSSGGEGEGQSTASLAKAFGQAADESALLEKEERSTINALGDRMANARMNPLYSQYLSENTLAQDLTRQSMGNLFAEGGQIPKPVTMGSGFEKLASTVLSKLYVEGMNKGGLVPVEQAAKRNPTFYGLPGPIHMNPGSIMRGDATLSENLRWTGEGIKDIVSTLFGANEKRQEPNKPQLGDPNKTQEQVAKTLAGSQDTTVASTVGGQPAAQPAATAQSGTTNSMDDVSSIENILKQLGISKDMPKRPKESPLMTLLGTLGAYGGTNVSGPVARNRAMAAMYGANEANVDNVQKQDQQELERKMKAIETAAAVRKLNSSDAWLEYQKAVLASKMGGKTGKGKEKDPLDQLRKMLQVQKMQREAAADNIAVDGETGTGGGNVVGRYDASGKLIK